MIGLPKENARYKSWYGWLWLVIIILAIVLGIWQKTTLKDSPGEVDTTYLNEQTCTDGGGDWNDCGSACRDEPGAPCIAVCVEMCECEMSAQCPYGFTCGDIIDGNGVCSRH